MMRNYDELIAWGRLMDKERPNGLGASLLEYAISWQEEVMKLRKECDKLREIVTLLAKE